MPCQRCFHASLSATITKSLVRTLPWPQRVQSMVVSLRCHRSRSASTPWARSSCANSATVCSHAVVWSLSQSVLLWAQLTSAEGDSGGSPGSVGVTLVSATSADASVRGQTGLPEVVLRGARQRCATATGRGAWPVCPDGWGPSPECNRLGVSRIRRPLWLHPPSRLARGRARQHRATGPYDQPSLRARSDRFPWHRRHPKRQPTACRHGTQVDDFDKPRSGDLGFRP